MSSGGSCDAGYDSYSLSSTDSLPLQQGLRANFQLAQIPEIIARGDCEALCREAERLLERSAVAEAAGDAEAAALLCDAAAGKARAAMDAPYNNPHTMTFARMKHNSCLMRARSLQRRVPGLARAEPPPRAAPDPAPVPIEIYATLPKKKGSSKKSPKSIDDDIDVIGRERPPRHKSRDDDKTRDKRSRSEDRGRARKEPPAQVTAEKKEEPPADDKKNKKQHKIRRKLLMGGLIRRKNRSMPDLTEGGDGTSEPAAETRVSSVDDAEVGRRTADDKSNLSGYLSEGHLEYPAPSNSNPTLERSKLMRKSFHGSAGKMLTAAKVPPPPPLRTTSQLSARHDPPRHEPDEDGGFSEQYGDEPHSMPFMRYDDNDHGHYDSFDNSLEQNFHTVVTTAMIHQEQSPVKRDLPPSAAPAPHAHNLTNAFDNGVDVVDCALPSRPSQPTFELPPYPSPMNSVNHSRQPSEEFPPPPSPINMSSVLDEINRIDHDQRNYHTLHSHNNNHYQMNEDGMPKMHLEPANTVTGLLKELQAKQMAFKLKRSGSLEGQLSCPSEGETTIDNGNSVRNMASRFENGSKNTVTESDRSHVALVGMGSNRNVLNLQPNLYVRRASSSSIDPNQMEEEHVEKTSTETYGDRSKPKKKSVSFCDQVILVSTAEDQEDDSYIPNPILERVLKSAMNKPELTTLPLQSEKSSLHRQESFDSQSSRSTISSLSHNSAANEAAQPGYGQPQHEYTSPYLLAQSRVHQQYNAQKSTGVYGTNSPVQMIQNQTGGNNNQIYQALPSAQHATGPVPYTQPPAYTGQSGASPPNFSQNPANRMTPTSQNLIAKQTNNLPRTVPNTYPHPPSQLHQMSQPPNNAYYHRLPASSQASTLNGNYNNRPYNQSAQYNHGNQSPYQSVPSNSPPYHGYHNPPTSYASSEYSSRYPQPVGAAPAAAPAPSPYQRVPPPHGDPPLDNYNATYQPIKTNNYYHDINSNQPRQDARHYANSQQQRPMYNQNANESNGAPNEQMGQYQYSSGYNPYQHLPTKQLQKKSVSFEPGTKGGSDSPVPPQMPPYPPGEPATFHAGAPKLPCNLCRKKLVNPPAMYCPDCDFYMSRFKPRS